MIMLLKKIKNRLILFEFLIMIKILLISSTTIASNNENLKFHTKDLISNAYKQNEFLSYALNMVHNNDTHDNVNNNNNIIKKMDNKKLLSLSSEVLEKPNFSVIATNLLGEVRKLDNNNNNNNKKNKVKKINSQGRVSFSSIDLIDYNQKNSSRVPLQKFTNYIKSKIFNNNTDRFINNTNEDLILKKQQASVQFNGYENNNSNLQISYLEFDLLVNDFDNFEPKTGMISINAKLKYKWWYNNQDLVQAQRYQSSSSSSYNNDSFLNNTNDSIYPKLEFRNKNPVKLKISNQFHKIENEDVPTKTSINAERLFSNKPQKLQANKQNNNDKKYSYLEQNVNLNFKCKNFLDSESDEIDYSVEDEEGIDITQFPFDVHRCSLEFDLIANSKNNNSIYLFPTLKGTDFLTKLNNVNRVDYFKLVKHLSNNSLFAQEWILKRVYINYFNSTSTLFIPKLQHNGNISSSNNNIDQTTPIQTIEENNEESFPINDYIMSLALNGDQIRKKREIEQAKGSTFLSNIQPAKVSIDFLIYRRREPQVYLFILPLVIFTLITFLIFFLPTTKGSEKSLIALLNCAFLIAYNIYSFKMIVITYDLARIPLILKYSNCLMIIQLAVLAYTCLVKSIYLNGFLTFSSRTYMNASEELYNQIVYSNKINHNHEKNMDYDVDLIKKCDALTTSMQQQTYCVPKAAAAHNSSSSNSDVIGKSIDEINAFGMAAPNTIATIISGTIADESNYTVYNNIDHPCDCSTTDAECPVVNATRDDNYCDETNNNNNNNSNENEGKSNEYGMILDYNKSSNQSGFDENNQRKSNWLFTMFCCASGLFQRIIKNNNNENDKTIATGTCVDTGTLGYDYASHLGRNIKLPINGQTSTFRQIISQNCKSEHDISNDQKMPRNLSFLGKQNHGQSLFTPFQNRQQIIEHPVNILNTHLKQLVKFEELHLREKLIKDEWRKKARFCDGICCLFIFFILVTCSICIFAILPTVKISSMVD